MQDMRSDAEIVQAVLGGDVNAFEALVLRYQKKVYNTVLRLTGDSVQAEDLSQEVFLKIFRGLSSFRGESSFSTYIYRVAANTAIDALRRREAPTVSLSAENEEGEEFELALPDPGPLPVELLESRERRQAIRAAIDALPEHHRTVILLRELDGMSYQDIAKVMGLTEGTVKSRINRARARLRQLLLEGNFFEERATKEKDLEETALKTNLEACDEIARQLRMRNLAGLVVIDFIDMEEPANNHAIEKRMKEALKKDRSRIQVGKMSCFGLLEISRQRMHSSFWESNYQTCPCCNGKGMVRTTESGAVMVLRGIEEEGIKNRSSKVIVTVPSDVALYILNHKRQNLVALEHRYKMEIVISADDSIKNISDYTIERTKCVKSEPETAKEQPKPAEETNISSLEETVIEESGMENESGEPAGNDNNYRRRNGRRDNRRNRRNGRDRNERNGRFNRNNQENNTHEQPVKEKQQAVILYNSHEDTTSSANSEGEEKKEKTAWWKKIIG